MGGTVSLARECEEYVSSLGYYYSSDCPIKLIVWGPYRYRSVANCKCSANDNEHTFLVHRGIVEGLLNVNLSDYPFNNIDNSKRLALEVGIPIVRAAMAARIQLWGLGTTLGLINKEEEDRVRREVYRLSGPYINPDRA